MNFLYWGLLLEICRTKKEPNKINSNLGINQSNTDQAGNKACFVITDCYIMQKLKCLYMFVLNKSTGSLDT